MSLAWALLALAAAAQLRPVPAGRREVATTNPLVKRRAAAPAAPPGWKLVHARTLRRFPWGLDARTATAMREFGLVQRQIAEFDRGSSPQPLRTVVLAFADARGAYGAKTYLRAQARAADHVPLSRQVARQRWLLIAAGPVTTPAWRHWVDQIAGQTASAMPLLRQHLPRGGLVPQSAAYAEGPVGLAAVAPWLPANAVNFTMEPLIATGQYLWAGSQGGQLALLSYPTPQIAAAQLKEIAPHASLARRSGPLVVAWHGAATDQARQLVGAVHYNPIVTWSNPLGVNSLPGLILAIFVLVGFIAAVFVVAGLVVVGLRLGLAKWFPQRFAFGPERIIRLKL